MSELLKGTGTLDERMRRAMVWAKLTVIQGGAPEARPARDADKRRTGREVDKLIEEYDELQLASTLADSNARFMKARADQVKAELVAETEKFGQRHTDKSKRLRGVRHSSTTTTATLVQVDDEAVDGLRVYADQAGEAGLREKFFSERTVYQLVKGPSDVLSELTLPAKVRRKMEQLVALCFRVTTKAPSLKVELGDAKD